MVRRSKLLLLVAVLLFGCKKTQTQLTVVVDSDLDVPVQFAILRISIDEGGETLIDQELDVTGLGLPLSFAIEPDSELADDEIAIRFTTVGADSPVRIDRLVEIGFEEGHNKVLPIFLSRLCVGQTCGMGTTCIRGPCETAFVEAGLLADFDGAGSEFSPGPIPPDRLDGGVPVDGGVGQDVGTPDVGTPDAGNPDADPADVPIVCNPDDCPAHQLQGAPPQCTCLPECEDGFQWTGSSCSQMCDPFDEANPNPCEAGFACVWTQQGLEGLCAQDQGGSVQGEPCTATFDGMGQLTGHTCNAAQNFYCIGASPAEPDGICASVCLQATGFPCDLMIYDCVDAGVPGVGICRDLPPPWTDIGADCTMGPDCQSGLCEVDVVGAGCSHDCDNLGTCPAGAQCLGFVDPMMMERWRCFLDCDDGNAQPDQALCDAVDPMKVCQGVGPQGMEPWVCLR